MNVEKLDSKEKVNKLMGRFNALKQKRSQWEDLWEDSATFIHPRRENMLDLASDGEKTGANRYSSYPVKANQTHADGIQGYLISPSIKWFKLKTRNTQMMSVPFAKDWIEQCEDEIYGIFRGTNFYAASGEFLLDAGAICTACFFSEWSMERDTAVFKTINPAEIVIAEDNTGMVTTVMREFYMTAEQMKERFGDKLSENVKKELEDYTPDEKHKVLHCVFPRRRRDEKKEDNLNMRFGSIYIDMEEEKILTEGGYEENPYLVLRYRKNSGETYGRGPGIDAMVEILRLNQFSKGQLKLAQLQVDPPMNIPGKFKGRIRYQPGAHNYLGQGAAEIQPLKVPGNYAVGEAAMNEIKNIIDDFFNVEYFQMLQRAERQMTAREVIERQGEKAAVLGSAVGRIYQEFLNPLIQRVFLMLHRAGKIPEPPQELLQMGIKLEVDLIGPLAMAQKYYAKSQGITKSIEGIAPLVQFDQSVLDWFDFGVLAKDAAEAAGMPQSAIREDHEVQQMRQQRAEQQQAQAQMEQQQQMADMVPKLNQKVEEGSPLEALDEQLAAGVAGAGGMA